MIFFALKNRDIETYQPMNTNFALPRKGGKPMEFLIPLGVLALWILLQAWILPRLGVKT